MGIKQSQIMSNREELYQRLEKLEQQFKNKKVSRPEFWSGFRLLPQTIEFWQQGQHRLHERICYHKSSDGAWITEFLYP
jgi:pyridoxamine 5'-phosphate oxidase